MSKKIKVKALTLKELTDYGREILLPAIDECFVVKKDFLELKLDFHEHGADFKSLKTEFQDFKNKSLTGQDTMLKKLDELLDENKLRNYQEVKEKKLWAIVIKSLKEHKILSSQQLKQIAGLEIF